jgi:hypothetical protein
LSAGRVAGFTILAAVIHDTVPGSLIILVWIYAGARRIYGIAKAKTTGASLRLGAVGKKSKTGTGDQYRQNQCPAKNPQNNLFHLFSPFSLLIRRY